jgi:hypothetical protein
MVRKSHWGNEERKDELEVLKNDGWAGNFCLMMLNFT